MRLLVTCNNYLSYGAGLATYSSGEYNMVICNGDLIDSERLATLVKTDYLKWTL